MTKNAILIVIYNKKLDESKTINTLIKFPLKSVRLTLYNNGPQTINDDNPFLSEIRRKCCSVVLVNYLENKPLSFIYNSFLLENSSASQFIFFDDDSTVTESFYSCIENNTSDVELPKIISTEKNKIYYPIQNKIIITTDKEIYLDEGVVYSIGSGLIINSRVIDIFKKYDFKLFDENYAFYGVDFSFFRRLNFLVQKGDVVKVSTTSSIIHDLSGTNAIQSPFRIKERLFDVAISAKRYPSLETYKAFFKKIIINIMRLKGDYLFLLLKTYFVGIHPKCNSVRVKK
ncbi:glycosyl transferase [Pectobacterium colocasium]|uniref:glycosyl transferase n=1 Tax=Pectobacterium colocasium TaxID=2878098 RepID=UPI00330632AF